MFQQAGREWKKEVLFLGRSFFIFKVSPNTIAKASP